MNGDYNLDKDGTFNLLHDAMLTEFPDVTTKVFSLCIK